MSPLFLFLRVEKYMNISIFFYIKNILFLYFLKGLLMNTYINKLISILENNSNFINKIKGLHKTIIYDKNNITVFLLKDLGDFICLTPFLKALRKKEKDAYITFVCYKKIYPLVEYCPYINRIICIDNYLNITDYNINNNFLLSLIPLIKVLLDQGSIKIAFHPYWIDYNQLVNVIMFLTGTKERIAFAENDYQRYLSDKNFDNYICNDVNFITRRLNTPLNIVHTIDRNLYMLEAFYNCKCRENLELWINKDDYIKLNKTKFNIIIGIGGSSNSKKYPNKKWEKIINSLNTNNIHFIIVGGKNDEKINLPFVTNYVNKLSIRQIISVISQSNLYVGHDTCFVHIASTYKIPSIVLYKESLQKLNYYKQKNYAGYLSSYERWYPYECDHIALFPKISIFPCNKKEIIICGCESNISHCISRIKENDIINAINFMLQKYQ